MSLQNPYTQTISPKSISEPWSDSRFLEFMTYFQRDCDLYIDSCSQLSDLLVHFYQIKSELLRRAFWDGYLERVEFHSRITDFKVNSVDTYLEMIWREYLRRNDEIYDLVQKELGKTISLPPTKEEFESLTAGEKIIVEKAQREMEINYIRFIAGIGAFVDIMFFAFESACKVSCSLGCYAYSIQYARSEIMSHGDIWRTLKILGKVDGGQDNKCLICSMEKTCHFAINFEALANVYCYAIKIRMLSDYSEFFYAYKNTWEMLKLYFQKLKDLINVERKIKMQCLG